MIGAVLGDLHLGKSLYGYDTTPHVLKAMHSFLNLCVEQEVSWAVQLGDVFDVPTPKEEHRKLFVQWLNEFERNKIRLFVMAGNHDVLSRGAPSALSSVKPAPWKYVKIVDRPRVFPMGARALMFAPFPSPILFAKSESWEQACYERIPNGKKTLLFTHANIDGASFGDQDIVYRGADHCLPKRVIKHPDVQSVLAGHIHKPQRCGKVVLLGAAERLRFDEKNQARYFGLVTEGGKVKLVTRADALSMQEIAIDVSCWGTSSLAPTTDAVLEYLQDYALAGTFVKVVPYVGESCSVNWKEVATHVKDAGAIHVHIAPPIKAIKEKEKPETAKLAVNKPNLAAKRFIASQITSKKVRASLLAMFKQFRKEVDHA